MKYEIENVPVVEKKATTGSESKSISMALRGLEIGQSFVLESINTNTRNILRYGGRFLDAEFKARKQPDGTYRVGRTR